MTFSGTLTMRQRHSPTNREEGGVGGDGKGLAAVKGKGERERGKRTKDCGMITRFQSLRVTPTPQPKMEEEGEGRIERGALHCWISRAAGFPFSMNIYSVAKRMLEAFLDK